MYNNGGMSVNLNCGEKFDPIATIELANNAMHINYICSNTSMKEAGLETQTVGLDAQGVANSNMGEPSKRPRGRPKNSLCSLPSASPLKHFDEARETLNTAKLLGVSSGDEDVVLKEIRKAKRLLFMEGEGFKYAQNEDTLTLHEHVEVGLVGIKIDPLATSMMEAVNRAVDENVLEKFDPMTTMETAAGTVQSCGGKEVWQNGSKLYDGKETNTCGVEAVKHPRGRPRKISKPLGEPNLAVLSQSRSLVEAQKTWELAKLLGASACDEEAMVKEMEKSKRILLLEENAN
ncbi:unnamed protein product [Amaranthus hypochondriacus]